MKTSSMCMKNTQICIGRCFFFSNQGNLFIYNLWQFPDWYWYLHILIWRSLGTFYLLEMEPTLSHQSLNYDIGNLPSSLFFIILSSNTYQTGKHRSLGMIDLFLILSCSVLRVIELMHFLLIWRGWTVHLGILGHFLLRLFFFFFKFFFYLAMVHHIYFDMFC